MLDKIIVFLAKIDCSKKNPIEYSKLLRNAGQSCDEEIDKIREGMIDNLLFYSLFFIIILFGILIFKVAYLNYFSLGLPLLFFIILLLKISKAIKKIRNYKLGRDGERAVAQQLYNIARQVSKAESNMRIYHDIVDNKKGFNIDHIVLSKKGIFIFETKTYRKSSQYERNEITVKDGKIYKNNYPIQKNIPLQVKGQEQWLQSKLEQALGKKYPIISTIIFIGWYVEDGKIDTINIINARNIQHILENQYNKVIYNDEELTRIKSVIHTLATHREPPKQELC